MELRDVAERGKAPRGSIYHHFPEGKLQLATEAASSMAERVAVVLERSLAEQGVRWLARGATGFPALLGAIHDPPPGLFARGSAELAVLSETAVAVVGARACSGYGAHVLSSRIATSPSTCPDTPGLPPCWQ